MGQDLHRTGLKEYTTSPEMIEKLGRVLKAFAWRNPDVGYCQAMNFIAGLLLLQMPETNAFWTLCSIIEDIMPKSYYDETMKALHVDIRVFSDLVKEKLSKLHQHILGLEIVLQPLTIIWFLGLFVHAAPEETVCRIWDSLFLEGSKMLFRFSDFILFFFLPRLVFMMKRKAKTTLFLKFFKKGVFMGIVDHRGREIF